MRAARAAAARARGAAEKARVAAVRAMVGAEAARARAEVAMVGATSEVGVASAVLPTGRLVGR